MAAGAGDSSARKAAKPDRPFLDLFEIMRRPTSDACDGEDRRIWGQPRHEGQRSDGQIDVRVLGHESSRCFQQTLNCAESSVRIGKPVDAIEQQVNSRVAVPVDLVSEAGDPSAG